MVKSMKRLRDLEQFKDTGLVEVNMSPLVDMVFLLLIFFMVTSVFVQQQVVDIDKPSASQSHAMETESIQFSLTRGGKIFYKGNEISPVKIRPILARAMLMTKTSVVIVADEYSNTKDLITLMDDCRSAGVKNVSVATSPK